MSFGGLRTVISSPTITLNFQRGMRVIQAVTSLGSFGRAKMAANLGLTSQLRTAEKAVFAYRMKKSLQCFQVRLKLYY